MHRLEEVRGSVMKGRLTRISFFSASGSFTLADFLFVNRYVASASTKSVIIILYLKKSKVLLYTSHPGWKDICC